MGGIALSRISGQHPDLVPVRSFVAGYQFANAITQKPFIRSMGCAREIKPWFESKVWSWITRNPKTPYLIFA
jgi:hypothetical protein